eukprot:6181069-Pleurochrysis_carterae.AAC.1
MLTHDEMMDTQEHEGLKEDVMDGCKEARLSPPIGLRCAPLEPQTRPTRATLICRPQRASSLPALMLPSMSPEPAGLTLKTERVVSRGAAVWEAGGDQDPHHEQPELQRVHQVLDDGRGADCSQRPLRAQV